MINRTMTGIAAGLLLTTGVLHGQVDPDEFSLVGSMAAGVGSAVRDFTDLVGASMLATAQIEEARGRFWAAYPDKPGFEEASAHFADLLWQKDQLYMMGFLIEGPPEFDRYEASPSLFDVLDGRATRLPSSRQNLGELLFALAGGVDGGIDPELNRWFFAWVRAVRRGMGATNDRQLLLFNPLQYPDALMQAEEEYHAYARLRDRKELWKGPHSPLHSDDPQHVLAGAFARGGMLSFDEAHERAQLLEEFAGPEAVWYLYELGTVGQRVGRSTVRYQFGDLLPFRGDEAFVPDTPRGWLAWMYMPMHFRDLPEGIAQIQALFDEHGEERVMDAAERLRSIGRAMGTGQDLADYSGHPRQTPRWWLMRLLEDPATQLPTITEPIVVDARDTALLEEVAARRLAVRIVGTVTHATWRWSQDAPRTASRHPSYGTLQLHVEGADHLEIATTCCASGPYTFTGYDGELVVSKRIAVYSTPVPTEDGGFRVALGGRAGMIEVVDDSVQPVATLPPGLIDPRLEDASPDAPPPVRERRPRR